MTEAVSGSSNDYYLPDKNQAVKEQKGLADPEAFLKILVAQMKHQNPMEPQDSETFISQLTQMASMEQMYNMGRSMDKMAAEYEMSRYFQLIGQQVSLAQGDDIITGQVGGVTINDNKPSFYFAGAFNGERYTLDQVIGIAGATNDNLLIQYLALVGRRVTIMDGDSEITGEVEKVLLQNGSVSVRVNGSDYSAGQITELLDGPEDSTDPGGTEAAEEAAPAPGTETGNTEETTTEV